MTVGSGGISQEMYRNSVASILATTSLLLSLSFGAIQDAGVPFYLHQCLDQYGQNGTQTDDAPSYFFACFEMHLIRTTPARWPGWNVSLNHPWVRTLFSKTLLEISANKPLRVRREYRSLSPTERDDFHEAVNALKRDTTVFPNKFDTLAAFHSDSKAAVVAHGGPTFLLWHRIHLLLYEIALREKVPNVTVPYWDYTLDSVLSDPRESLLWSAELLGNGLGPVTDGPFANWNSQSGPLIRNVGNRGSLPDKTVMDGIASKLSLADIGFPETAPGKNLEFLHGSVHEWVGGQHSILDASPFDPAFLLLHSYIDYIWNRVEINQIRRGMRPENGYPTIYGEGLYAPTASIGIAPVSNLQALKICTYYTQYVYTYEPTPECSAGSNQCKSPFLECVGQRCVARKSPKVDLPSMSPPYQNNFCIDTQCDIDLWAYVPVQVVRLRPNNKMTFRTCSVKRGRVVNSWDVYNPQLYSEDSTVARRFDQSCLYASTESGADVVSIQSSGFNYGGIYKEDAVIDQRLGVSSTVAYVGIKDPASGPSHVFLMAYASDSTVCQPKCLVRGSSPPRYRDCYGSLLFTADSPKLHSRTIPEASQRVWQRERGSSIPRFRQENIPLLFYCDSSGPLPRSAAKGTGSRFSVSGSLSPAGQTSHSKCFLALFCQVRGPCQCFHAKTTACIGSRHYAECVFGKYLIRDCPVGTQFHEESSVCVMLP